MKVNEILNEDDYYGDRDVESGPSEDDLQRFVDRYATEHLGAPHRAGVQRDMGVIVSVPRNKNRKEGQRWDYDGQRDEWLETSEDLIEELDNAGFGRYELVAITANYIELEKTDLYESTTAGGIATVVSGAGAPAFTRNASIYGQKKPGPRKKKKAGPYANSKQD